MDAIAVVADEGEGVGVAGEGEGARKMEKGSPVMGSAFQSLCRWRRGRGGPGEGKGTRLLYLNR